MKIILGDNPLTSIAGYLVAGLLVAQNYLDKGETSWLKIGIAVGIAILGRVSADSANKA
jgi:hypothetical protein